MGIKQILELVNLIKRKKVSNFLSKSLIHDIEILPNFFSDIFKIPGQNKLFITFLYEDLDWNDSRIHPDIIEEIKNGFKDYEIKFFTIDEIRKRFIKTWFYSIGYNNYHYDDIIIKEILRDKSITNDKLYSISQSLIGDNKNKLKYDETYIKTIDLMRVSGCDRIYKPLKQTAANLKHDLIQDLPRKYNETIEPYEIPEILLYELNDVLITEKLLLGIPETQTSLTIPKSAYRGLLPAIEFRFSMGEKFGMDLYNNNKSQIGEKLARILYSRTSGRDIEEFKDTQTKRTQIKYSDVIFDNIKFKTPELNVFINKLRKLEYNPELKPEKGKKSPYMEQFYFSLKIFDLVIEFKQGGLHATHEFQTTFDNDKRKVDIDGTSYYPFLYTKYHIEPEHLKGFVEFVNYLIELRVKFKSEGDKVSSNGIKIPINRCFGINII